MSVHMAFSLRKYKIKYITRTNLI